MLVNTTGPNDAKPYCRQINSNTIYITDGAIIPIVTISRPIINYAVVPSVVWLVMVIAVNRIKCFF